MVMSSRNRFRLIFKSQTGREVYGTGNFFIKRYTNESEFIHEFNMLKNIWDSRPFSFSVPRVFKIYSNSNCYFIIMEKIDGIPLENYILSFILFRNESSLRVFNDLGKALRELHYSLLEDSCKGILPNSYQKIRLGISSISEKLANLHVLDDELKSVIIDAVKKMDKVDERVFVDVNLHGEFYFTHVIHSKGRFVFIDFHNACKGPSYFDLAMFATSLYASVMLPYFTPKQLRPLIQAFLSGYYGEVLNEKVLKSIKLTMLYVILREILVYVRALHSSSHTKRLLAMIKIKRLKTAIEEEILPDLLRA